LRTHAKHLIFNSEEESARLNVLAEINQLIEVSESNRKTLALTNGNSSAVVNIGNAGGSSAVALEHLNLHSQDDIVRDERPLSSLRVGNILDAQDYLGSWHLSIIIEDVSHGEKGAAKTIHFLPF